MILKPQDVLVVLKFVALNRRASTYNAIALDLEMSPSQLHSSVRRLANAGLVAGLEPAAPAASIRPNLSNLEEFLVHGVKYVFVAEFGKPTRGIATLFGAPPISRHVRHSKEPAPVWPYPTGDSRGPGLSPIYKHAPAAARKDNSLYELLVILDALRVGRARERDFGIKEMKQRFSEYLGGG